MDKTVLCYGDSNTYGAATIDRPFGRYAPNERWPGILAAELGMAWRVIEEGLPGRTTVSDDPIEGADKNGRNFLLPCLLSHSPLDVVILMLGTNDLKARFNKSAWEIAQGIGVLVRLIRSTMAELTMLGYGFVPEILIVSPPPIRNPLPKAADVEMFAGALQKSRQLSEHYRTIATSYHTLFLDAGVVAQSSASDGFHLDLGGHEAIGKAIAAILTS
jgi:lysophospholipase L1-like esterase